MVCQKGYWDVRLHILFLESTEEEKNKKPGIVQQKYPTTVSLWLWMSLLCLERLDEREKGLQQSGQE